jgi:putative Holliday junction resolvase|tara:strand:- start:1755 stop:2111 length:357 start_codon:yes stop_codon:yes gene_type:complete
VLQAKNGMPDWDKIKLLLDDWKPNQVIVGLPLNMDGSESDFCIRARKFARRIHGKFGIKVEMVDERLSTFEAKHQNQLKHEKNKKHSSTNYRDNPVDDLAAVLILQTWLSDPTIAVLP